MLGNGNTKIKDSLALKELTVKQCESDANSCHAV